MRKTLLIGIVAGLLLVAGSSIWATGSASADGGPHRNNGTNVTSDRCASCHRAHTAKAAKLLLDSQPGLCYLCHGGGGAELDAEYGIEVDDAGTHALRGGGFAFAMIDSSHPTGQGTAGSASAGTIPALAAGAAVTSAHTVDGSTVKVWGNGALGSGAGGSSALRCTSCHEPHGGANNGTATWRILRPQPKLDAGLAVGSGVVIPDAATKVYTTSNYWDVAAGDQAAFISNIPSWCSSCHTRYLRDSNGPKTEAGSGEEIFKFGHMTNSTSQNSPTCIQCHVAHGTNAQMTGGSYSNKSGTMPWPDGTGPAVVTPKPAAGWPADQLNNSRLLRVNNRGVCQMCHNR